MRLSIRWKLTLWYGGVVLLVLVGFSIAVYLTMRHHLLQRIDSGLAEELADVLSEVRRAKDESGLHDWLNRRFAHHEGFDFQISRTDGERFFVNPRLETTPLPLPEKRGRTHSPSFRIVALGERRRWRVISVLAEGPNGELIVQVARSLEAFDHESQELLLTFLSVGPLTLLVVVCGGYFLARRTLGPVDRITSAANRITAEHLNQRIDITNPDDELGALARTLNSMIGRLERSFTEMQRFTADAAHELRTPLAVMRNEAEVALRACRSSDEYRRVLENLLEEVNRLSYLADQLLFLSREEAGLHSSVNEPILLGDLLRDVVENMQLVARDRAITLHLQDSVPCTIESDSRRLRRVLYNLLDNAIKYTEPPGQVRVHYTWKDNQLTIAVADTGVGIPADQLPHVFERFYRVDLARSDQGEGTGLGLAICKSCVAVLQGSIRVESIVGSGTTMTIVLPLRRQA